ncbi:TNF receptor-associated factor 4-like [Dysidea avara]|uniref:TNF receptor-associated factor 4-like n=1 Tax=Dysidea avara TaxID=196820 RepID=UPI00331E2626
MSVSSPGGYEYQFVETPHERYICKICIHPCQDAYLSGCCGHNFCKSCLDNTKRTTTCPFCQGKTFSTFPNVQADREIRSFSVMCTNKESGCEWQGELNDINYHLENSDGCLFEDVLCSNGCGKTLQRRYLTSHVETECPGRFVLCHLCYITGPRKFIEGEHEEECPKLTISCPNKCKAMGITREDMEAHRKECPLEMVQCEYHSMGCEERMLRKRKRNHEEEKMEEHLLMTKFKLAKTEDKLTYAEAKLTSTETRLSRLEVMMHQLIHTTGSSSRFIESEQWSSYLTNLTTDVAAITQTCPVVMKMPEFAECKQRDVAWYSEPFYSHNRGHKLNLRIDVNGDGAGKGTHLSLFLYLMKGPHDDELTWPLRGKFEVTLLNQISDYEHYSVTVTYGNHTPDKYAGKVTDDDRGEGWGRAKFIFNQDLHKITPTCQYLKDDCIFIQVSKL